MEIEIVIKLEQEFCQKLLFLTQNLYANISDKSNYASKTDIVVIDAIEKYIRFRNSWRENF